MWVLAVGPGPVVSTEDAVALADAIEPHLGENSWLIHLQVWGDRDGAVVRQFIAFLRGGGFSVIDLREIVWGR
jgi:hypothetical protein